MASPPLSSLLLSPVPGHSERSEESHIVCPVIGNAVKQSSEGVCTWIASGCAFAMTIRWFYFVIRN
jgi:hypothetical protein